MQNVIGWGLLDLLYRIEKTKAERRVVLLFYESYKITDMNKKTLLLGGLLSCFSFLEAAPAFDFENGAYPGDSWDCESEIVENPSKDDVNGSGNCLKATFSETWGAVASFSHPADYSKQALALLVYTEDGGKITARAYNQAEDKNYEISQMSKAGKWTRLTFDFSEMTSSSNSIIILSGAKNTIYLDDIELISLSELPKKETLAYTYGSLAIGGGGFVAGIVASGDAKYARTDVGGAYKWNAANCSWMPVTNFISEDEVGLYSVEGLAIDPSNTDNVYMISGCQYFSNAMTAVMFSKDGGKTFTTVDVSGLLRVHGNGNGRNCGERIAVDPNNGDVIFAGGRAGSPVIKSVDGGKTWNAVSTFPNVYETSVNWPSWTNNSLPTTSDQNGVTAVVFDGSQKDGGVTSRIFVGVSRTSGSNVYVSEDGGSSWAAVSGLPSNLIPCRMKMDPDNNLLIAYSNACVGGASGAIYRYNPNSKVAEDISPSKQYAFGDVAVSPKDAKKLVASTNNTWIPQAWDDGKSANGDIYWTSVDGGKTWRSLQNNMTLTNNGVTWIPGYAIHWSGCVIFDPKDDNKVSITSGNGIFTCNNVWCDGKPTFYFDVNGLEETVALDMVSVPGGDLMSVIGDYTGFVHKNIHEFAPIHNPAPGTTGGINYYSKNPDVMMRVANTGFFCTTTGHDGWMSMSKTPYSYQNPYCAECAPLASNEGKCAITKKDGTYRFFLIPDRDGNSGLYYSDNNGESWTKVNGTDGATHVQVDPENDAYVYVGGKNKFWRSSDYGTTYTSQSLVNGDLGRIAIVPGHEGLVFAPRGTNGLAVSKNHGETFENLPAVSSCTAVGCGKGANDGEFVIYIWGDAGNGTGIYRSADNGASWLRINDKYNQFGGTGNGKFIVGDWNVYGRFYMSTVGLGIIYGELAENASSSSWSCFIDDTECKIESSDVDDVANGAADFSSFAFPNPFDESFVLRGEGDFVVADAIGQIVEAGTADGEVTLGANWASGLYVVFVDGQTFKVAKK